MDKPEQYIFDEWGVMCEEANKALHSDCPLIEDEVLLEMDKYITKLQLENSELRELVSLARNEYLEMHSDGEADCVTPYDYYS